MRFILLTLLLLLPALPAFALTQVALETSAGKIILDLDEEKAPQSVKNFLTYVDAGFYDGTIFHRVIKGFMIQGGGFSADLKRKPTEAPIKNEATNGLKNDRGTIAMARTSVVDSATSQFFINLVDNGFLNHRSADSRGYGYAVFGRVSAGMEVVDAIGARATRAEGAMFRNLPREQVVITRAHRVK